MYAYTVFIIQYLETYSILLLILDGEKNLRPPVSALGSTTLSFTIMRAWKIQEPYTTPSGRKVTESERKREIFY